MTAIDKRIAHFSPKKQIELQLMRNIGIELELLNGWLEQINNALNDIATSLRN